MFCKPSYAIYNFSVKVSDIFNLSSDVSAIPRKNVKDLLAGFINRSAQYTDTYMHLLGGAKAEIAKKFPSCVTSLWPPVSNHSSNGEE